jgi:hypothetical protein
MGFRRNAAAAVAATMLVSGVALLPVQASARTAQPPRPTVGYSFNVIRVGGIARSLGRQKLRLRMEQHWSRAVGADRKRHAVRFMAVSDGVIPNSARLTPHLHQIAIAVTFKLRSIVGPKPPNLVQQGYYADPAMWKVEVMPSTGHIRCRFKGTQGVRTVQSRTSINDHKFHTVVCFRLGDRIGVRVDDVTRARKVRVGAIVSSQPIRIGNKNLKDATQQFRGVMDYVAVALGRQPVRRVLNYAPSLK